MGEGFASLISKRKFSFQTFISIERDIFAHKTLLLRHFFRSFGPENPPAEYYNYIAGDMELLQLAKLHPTHWREANQSALKISLGENSHGEVKKIIARRLKQNTFEGFDDPDTEDDYDE